MIEGEYITVTQARNGFIVGTFDEEDEQKAAWVMHSTENLLACVGAIAGVFPEPKEGNVTALHPKENK